MISVERSRDLFWQAYLITAIAGERQGGREREREKERFCVCVRGRGCVCVSEARIG